MLAYKYKILTFLFLSLFLITVSCEDSSGPDSAPWVPNSQTLDVEWTEGTLVVDDLAKSNIVRIDTNNFIYTFKSSYTGAANLKVGDVLFIYGLALRKVTSVNSSSGEIVVRTGYASLNEAIKNGTVEWDQGIEFDPAQAPLLMYPDGKNAVPLEQIAGGKFELKFKISSFDGTVTVEVDKAKLNVVCSLEKSLSEAMKAKYELDGNVSRFRSKAKIKFQDNKCKEFDYKNEGLQGELKLTLIATATQNDRFNDLQLPFLLFEMPFIVGGIPVQVRCKILFVINTVMDASASAWVSTKFTYNSSTGIKWDGIKADVNGNIGPYKMDKDKTQTATAATAGASFGVGFPRLEVALFNKLVVPWVHTAFLIGGTMRNGTHPCQTADASFIGACGFNFEFLGLSLSGSKTLWQMDKILLRAGDCD